MRKLVIPLVLLFSLLIPNPYSLIPRSTQAAPTHEWRAPGNQYVPRTDGHYVVWLDGRSRATSGFRHFEIYGADLTTGQEFPVATGNIERLYPDVDQGIAVWAEAEFGCAGCLGDIAGKHLATGEEFVISATSNNETRPAITNGVAVWVEITSNAEILWMKDIFDGGDPVEIARVPSGWQIDLPRADSSKVAWSEYERFGPSSANYRLRAYDMLTGRYYEVAEGVANDVRGLRDDYDVHGTIVSWALDRELFIFEMETETITKLLDGGGCPTIDGNLIFYEDFRHFADERRIEVWGYDLNTGAQFFVAGAPGENHEYANVNNGAIVWQARTAGNDDVFAASITDVLPTAPETRAGEDSDDYRFFDETRHALATEFLSFWNASGGLPVFGYPLTGEYQELNPDIGEMLRVQYLERQRFEHHPDLAGTPYEVLIGRLGVTAAEHAGLLGSEPFQPVPADQTPDGCLYFDETGHTLCGRFLAYWQSQGLEFGDEGVTFRESLALFGLPLSEEFVDPGTGYVSQYFERAIFEYHPEHEGAEFEVLLRRLGVEELQARGWCTDVSFGCDPPITTQRSLPRMR